MDKIMAVYRLFAPHLCSRCLGPVSAHELVMYARQHIYHVDCFVCAMCERRLTTGQHFGMHRNAIYCQVSIASRAGLLNVAIKQNLYHFLLRLILQHRALAWFYPVIPVSLETRQITVLHSPILLKYIS